MIEALLGGVFLLLGIILRTTKADLREAKDSRKKMHVKLDMLVVKVNEIDDKVDVLWAYLNSDLENEIREAEVHIRKLDSSEVI